MSLAFTRGDFTDSDRSCPYDGKLLLIKTGTGGTQHVCPQCIYAESSSAGIISVSIRETVAAVRASQGVQHPTVTCGCGTEVIPAVFADGTPATVNAKSGPGGLFFFVGAPGSTPKVIEARRFLDTRTDLHREHKCGRAS